MSTINDSDLLLVERNGNLHQITYDQMSTLNDDDILLVERGGVQYKVEAQYVSTANGVIVPEVEVLTPLDRAGDPELTYLKSDTILAVEDDGGSLTFETDTISSVSVDRWVDNGSVTYAATAGDAQDPTADEVNKIFDGVWSENLGDTDAFFSITGTTPGTDHLVTLTFNPPIAYTSKVEVLHEKSFINGGQQVSHKSGINGSVSTNSTSGDRHQWFEIATGSGIMQSLTFGGNWPYAAMNFQSIRAIRVDGEVLTNTTTLSFPTSNNFDKFAVGDVVQGFEQQDWANVGTSSSWAPSAPLANAFDGSESTSAYPNPETTGSYTFATPLSYSYRVEILAMASVSQDPNFKVNGQLVPLVPNDGKIWVDVTSILDGTGGTFQSFTTSYSSNNHLTYIWAIRVDGTILSNNGEDILVKVDSINAAATPDPTITVDGGNWYAPSADKNQEYLWSATTSASPLVGTIEQLYNGDTSNGIGSGGAAGSVQTITLPAGLTPGSQLVAGSTYTMEYSLNGASYAPGQTTYGSGGTEMPIQSGTNTLSVRGTGSNSATVMWLIVDGKLLVDGGGDTSFSKTLNYATKLTLAGDTDLSQMALGPAVMTDGVLGGSGYSQTPYTLTTPEIESVTASLSYTDNCTWLVGDGDTVPNLFDGNPSTTLVLGGQPSTLMLDLTWLPAGGIENPGLIQTVVNVASMAGEFIANFGLEDESSTNSVTTGTHSIPSSPTLLKNLVWRTTVYDSASWRPINVYVNGVQLVDYTLNTLGFPGDVSTNPDLRYFKAGDVVDPAWDQSQTWSDLATLTFNGQAVDSTLLFDASQSTHSSGFGGANSLGVVATFINLPTPVHSQRIYLNGQGTPYVEVNGVTNVSGFGWIDMPLVQITSLVGKSSYSGFNAFINGIEIDGKMLVDPGISGDPGAAVISTDLAANTMTVDGGEWGAYDDSQVWSQQVTPEPRTQDPAANMFDGTTGSPGCIPKYPGDGGTGQATFVFNNSGSSTVRLTGYAAGSGTTLTVNGSVAFFDTDINFTGDLTLVWTSADGSNYHRIDSVTVDGKLLVDAVENTRVWSNSATNPSSEPNVIITNGFDGKTEIGDITYAAYTGGAFPAKNVSFAIAVQSTDTIRIKVQSDLGPFLIDTGNGTVSYPAGSGSYWLDISAAFTSNVTDWKIGSAFNWNFSGLEINGEVLVDAVIPNLDTRQATTTLPGGTGDLVEIDAASNAVYLTEGDRAWIPSNNSAGTSFALAAGSLANPPAPDYLDIAFTSMNAGTTPFTGVNATLSSRTWTLETGPAKEGPWTLVDTYEEFDMLASQDGATEWTTGKPVLNQSTWYRVKVTYNSTAAESVESDYHTFKTGV